VLTDDMWLHIFNNIKKSNRDMSVYFYFMWSVWDGIIITWYKMQFPFIPCNWRGDTTRNSAMFRLNTVCIPTFWFRNVLQLTFPFPGFLPLIFNGGPLNFSQPSSQPGFRFLKWCTSSENHKMNNFIAFFKLGTSITTRLFRMNPFVCWKCLR